MCVTAVNACCILQLSVVYITKVQNYVRCTLMYFTYSNVLLTECVYSLAGLHLEGGGGGGTRPPPPLERFAHTTDHKY